MCFWNLAVCKFSGYLPPILFYLNQLTLKLLRSLQFSFSPLWDHTWITFIPMGRNDSGVTCGSETILLNLLNGYFISLWNDGLKLIHIREFITSFPCIVSPLVWTKPAYHTHSLYSDSPGLLVQLFWHLTDPLEPSANPVLIYCPQSFSHITTVTDPYEVFLWTGGGEGTVPIYNPKHLNTNISIERL